MTDMEIHLKASEIERLINHFGGIELPPDRNLVNVDAIKIDFKNELIRGLNQLKLMNCITEQQEIMLNNTCDRYDDFRTAMNDINGRDAIDCLISRLKKFSSEYYEECESNED